MESSCQGPGDCAKKPGHSGHWRSNHKRQEIPYVGMMQIKPRLLVIRQNMCCLICLLMHMIVAEMMMLLMMMEMMIMMIMMMMVIRLILSTGFCPWHLIRFLFSSRQASPSLVLGYLFDLSGSCLGSLKAL